MTRRSKNAAGVEGPGERSIVRGTASEPAAGRSQVNTVARGRYYLPPTRDYPDDRCSEVRPAPKIFFPASMTLDRHPITHFPY